MTSTVSFLIACHLLRKKRRSRSLQSKNTITDQLINQPANESNNTITDQLINQPANESNNTITDQLINQQANESNNTITDQLINQQANESNNTITDQLTNNEQTKILTQYTANKCKPIHLTRSVSILVTSTSISIHLASLTGNQDSNYNHPSKH